MTSTTVSFVNASQETVNVYWIPSNNEKRLYRKLKTTGEAYTQPTYCGHQWNIEASNGDILLQATAHAEDFLHVIPSFTLKKKGDQTNITFQNNLTETIHLMYLKQTSKGIEEIDCAKVISGNEQIMNSYCGHEFRIRVGSAKGECIMQCIASDNHATYSTDLATLSSPFISCKNAKKESSSNVGGSSSSLNGGTTEKKEETFTDGTDGTDGTDDGTDGTDCSSSLLLCQTCYTTLAIEGFTICIEPHLAEIEPTLLSEIKDDLIEIKKLVPPSALQIIQRTRIYMNEQLCYGTKENQTVGTGIVHHQSPVWLKKHGNMTEKTGCVECYCARHYLTWRKQQPAMLLHELSHHLHFALGSSADVIIEHAFAEAEKSGKYENVAYCEGTTLKKHYALTNKHEYFAECSEAYFSSDRFRNDYYPFTKSELIEFDPVGVEMCNRLWVELPETMEAVRGAAKVKQ